jgi:hypothetical protein
MNTRGRSPILFAKPQRPWLLLAALGAMFFMPGSAPAQDACALDCSNKEAAFCTGQELFCAFNFKDCVAQCERQPGSSSPGPHYDPCYLAQNALRPCTGEQQKSAAPVGVDAHIVGTWELKVPTPLGVSRWVWEIHQDGTYSFHAEGPGATPAHSGTFAASKGHYTLNSTTLTWNDTGTYQLVSSTTLVVTGRLGTGAWQRVKTEVTGGNGL